MIVFISFEFMNKKNQNINFLQVLIPQVII